MTQVIVEAGCLLYFIGSRCCLSGNYHGLNSEAHQAHHFSWKIVTAVYCVGAETKRERKEAPIHFS